MATQGDPTNIDVLEHSKTRGAETLGLMTSYAWRDDPKRLAFTLSRYKFVSRILDGSAKVLEAGCGDGFGSRIVRQHVDSLMATDLDPELIESAKQSACDEWPVWFRVHDMLAGSVIGEFDGVYCLDVLEHIPQKQEDRFISNLITPLREYGVCIIGMPSLQSQPYASKYSKIGHINCKDQPTTRALMQKYFHNVFMFSMNDEAVHTGYQAMSHYNLAVCTGKRT